MSGSSPAGTSFHGRIGEKTRKIAVAPAGTSSRGRIEEKTEEKTRTQFAGQEKTRKMVVAPADTSSRGRIEEKTEKKTRTQFAGLRDPNVPYEPTSTNKGIGRKRVILLNKTAAATKRREQNRSATEPIDDRPIWLRMGKSTSRCMRELAERLTRKHENEERFKGCVSVRTSTTMARRFAADTAMRL